MEKPAVTGEIPARKSPFLAGCYLYAVTMILITIGSRLRLLSVPLERDEGGFAYIGQQLLRGIPPYESGNSIVAEIFTSWLFTETSEMMMIDWADRFLTDCYEKVGLSVLSPDKETIYYWGKEAGSIVPPWGSSLSVYRKRGADPSRLSSDSRCNDNSGT